MNKLLLFLLSVFALMFTACDDDAPDYPDTNLIKGQWQLVEDGSNENSLIYDFTLPCCERCYNRPTDTRQDENGQDMDGSAYRPCG